MPSESRTWLFWSNRYLLPYLFKSLTQPGPPFHCALLKGAPVPLSVWNSTSFSEKMSHIYLNLTFQFFFLLMFGASGNLSLGKRKTNTPNFSLLRMPWLLPFLCLCSRHRASVSISHRFVSPELFYSKVKRRIYSHLVNSNTVIQFFK